MLLRRGTSHCPAVRGKSPLYVLVPDDPVFFAKFQSLEEPLLRRLYRLQRQGLDSEEERVVADAYDAWVRVLLRLPLWPRWQATTDDATAEADAGYTLHGVRGGELTSLYPVELAPADLAQLSSCLRVLVEAGQQHPEPPPPEPSAGHEPWEGAQALVNVFRRVLGVLLLPSPPELLRALSPVGGGVRALTLGTTEEAHYRVYCADIVHILSSGDTFAYQSHLAMYM